MLDSRKELFRKFAEEEMRIKEEREKEIEQNPLTAYSTTELKKELRRRKRKTK
ncbi:hypothetical protein TPDSL_23060 [Terrisporobacter petrolearius]|uniref:hypothetical protein n=1 Tax=Terrisporobacter petrolearius TaxID=1460447 RepID=UPI0033670D7E